MKYLRLLQLVCFKVSKWLRELQQTHLTKWVMLAKKVSKVLEEWLVKRIKTINEKNDKKSFRQEEKVQVEEPFRMEQQSLVNDLNTEKQLEKIHLKCKGHQGRNKFK